jgi:hypothetical protein
MSSNLYRGLAAVGIFCRQQFEMKIPILLILTAFSLNSSAETDCSRLLANPVHGTLGIRYTVSVPDTPIVRQCGGTCHLESTAAFAENIIQVPLATSYNVIQFMRERTNQILRGNNLRKISIKDGYVDILTGTDPKTALVRLEKQGIVPQDKFHLTDQFLGSIAKMREGIEKSFSNSTGERLSDLQVFSLWVGVVLRVAKESVDKGGTASINGEPAQTFLNKIFDAALEGLQVDPHQELKKFFPSNENIVVWSGKGSSSDSPLNRAIFTTLDGMVWLFNRSLFRFSTSPKSREEIEPEIIKSLSANKAIQMSFTKIEALMDQKTGIIRLDVPSSQVKSDRARNPQKYLGGDHGVVIQGYEPDANGNIEWLLIRDSQGQDSYDHGYLHMHIDYFREFVISLMFH